MTREECKSLKRGTKCLIGDEFVEDAHDDIKKFLGTVQIVERVEDVSCGWIYFENVPQPFAFSEVVSIVSEVRCIDDESVPYQSGDICLIFGGSVS